MRSSPPLSRAVLLAAGLSLGLAAGAPAAAQVHPRNDMTLIQPGDLARFLDRLDTATTNIRAILKKANAACFKTKADYDYEMSLLDKAEQTVIELEADMGELYVQAPARGAKQLSRPQFYSYVAKIHELWDAVQAAKARMKGLCPETEQSMRASPVGRVTPPTPMGRPPAALPPTRPVAITTPTAANGRAIVAAKPAAPASSFATAKGPAVTPRPVALPVRGPTPAMPTSAACPAGQKAATVGGRQVCAAAALVTPR